MNTERSDAIIARFKNLHWEPKRISFEYQGPVYGRPETGLRSPPDSGKGYGYSSAMRRANMWSWFILRPTYWRT